MAHRFTEPLPKRRESSFGTAYFKSYSRKLSRCITAFSNIEYDNMIRCEMDHHVLWYCERPVSQEICFNGKVFTVNPDLYVEYDDGTCEFQLVDYKGGGHVDRNEAMIWSRQSGENVTFVSEDDLDLGMHYIRNLHWLYARARRVVSKSNDRADKLFVDYLRQSGNISVGSLISLGQIREEEGLPYLADLYYRGLIDFPDITKNPISYKTEVIAR